MLFNGFVRSDAPVSATLRKRIGHSCIALAATCLLMACSGGDSSNNESNNAPPQTAVAPAQPADNTPDESSPPALDDTSKAALKAMTGGMYYRAPEYPRTVSLPLQFFTASNGKKLAVRVVLPAYEKGVPAPGTFPVILTQTAYNSSILTTLFLGIPGPSLLGVEDPFLVRRGYAQVLVDAMGTGASEGGWELLGEDEQQGFADAVDWVEQQPWSNGKLGLAGLSYMAISALFAAERRPDAVDAIFASVPMGDAQRGTVGIGGQVNAVFMSTWMILTHFISTQNVPTMLQYPQHMSQLIRTTDEHVAQIEKFHLGMIDKGLNGDPEITYDSDFWRLRSPLTHIDNIKAPTFILGALDDIFQRDAPLLNEALKKNGVDSKLVIYNGTHLESFVMPHIGNAQVPPIDFLMIQWFDKYLRDMDTQAEALPEVVQYVKNYPTPDTPEQFRNDSYITTTTWPHPQAAPERWYLRGDMSLSQAAPTVDESGPYMTQPEHPSGRAYKSGALVLVDLHINDGTKCSRSHLQWTLGISLETFMPCRSNTNNTEQQRLIFESEPMEADYFINGPITADIWIKSTVTEAVVSVSVEDVSGNRSQPITDGQLVGSGREVDESRSRYLNGEMIQPYHFFTQETNSPLVPGEAVKMQVEIFPTSAVIRKGHKLRIAISPSNQSQAMLNYPRQDAATGGVTTLQLSPEHPSSVVFPIVPVSAMN